MFLYSVFFALMTIFAPLAIAATGTEATPRFAVTELSPAIGLLRNAGHQSLTSSEIKTSNLGPLVCTGIDSNAECSLQKGDCASPCIVLQILAGQAETVAAATLNSAQSNKIEGILGSDRLRPPI